MNPRKEIRRAVDTGKTVFGFQQSEKSILKGKGQLVILSNNIPIEKKENLKAFSNVAGIPVYEFDGSNRELGSVCGKAFVISVMVIQDKGKSKALDLIKTKQ